MLINFQSREKDLRDNNQNSLHLAENMFGYLSLETVRLSEKMSKHISASKRGFCLYIVAFYLFQIKKRNVLHTIKLRYFELSYLKLKFFYLGYCFQSFSSSDLQPWTSQTFLVNYTNKKNPEIELIGKVFFT